MASNLYFTTAGMKDFWECTEDMFDGCELHHIAWASGYVPCGEGCSGVLVEEYHGRFGDGYKLHVHNNVSTRWHLVEYLVK